MLDTSLCQNLQRGDHPMKRFIEIAIAVGLLLLCAPLLLIFALAIYLTTSDSVLTTRRHQDEQGKTFDVYYFRTPANVVGRWLRRFSMDTLPQLINVLRGEMSLIGPPLDR